MLVRPTVGRNSRFPASQGAGVVGCAWRQKVERSRRLHRGTAEVPAGFGHHVPATQAAAKSERIRRGNASARWFPAQHETTVRELCCAPEEVRSWARNPQQCPFAQDDQSQSTAPSCTVFTISGDLQEVQCRTWKARAQAGRFGEVCLMPLSAYM